MKNFLTILKKEFKRIFTDYRMYFALFLPGILIFILYSVMGNFMKDNVFNKTYENVTYKVAYTDNFNTVDSSSSPLLKVALDEIIKTDTNESTNKITYYPIKINEVEDYKTKAINSEIDVLIVYDDNFENLIFTPGIEKPNLNIFYNGADGISTHIYQLAQAIIPSLYNNYSVNMDGINPINPNLAETDFMAQSIMGYIFPVITCSLLFSGVMSLCPETIAGEKERGTLTSLLITPTKRTSIIFAKVTCLCCTTILSGLVSFLGIISSLPKMMGGTTFTFTPEVIICLLFLIISALLFFVVIGCLASAIAKTIKEATSYLGPFMGILLMVCFLPSLIDTSNIAFSFIPFLNIATSMNMIIAGQSINYLFLACSIVSNVLYSGVIILGIAKIFNSEQITYTK